VSVFWDVVLCSLVDIYRHSGGTYCLHHQGLIVSRSSEMSVNFYHTTRHRIPDVVMKVANIYQIKRFLVRWRFSRAYLAHDIVAVSEQLMIIE
jgi:hypothetical protein